MVFLTAATAAANHVGTEAGAAHQAVRQLWTFTAFLLDAYATAAQSLVGYFHGAGRRAMARRVAAVTCLWSLATGAALAALMAATTGIVTRAFVPVGARAVFPTAWWIAVASQPVNALSFATDGLHWGTGDYRFLRNGMLAATFVGGALLWALVVKAGAGLAGVWVATAAWIAVRALLGVLRVWPGIGHSPYRPGPGRPSTPDTNPD
jgi:MATE family multidrug resistance protein